MFAKTRLILAMSGLLIVAGCTTHLPTPSAPVQPARPLTVLEQDLERHPHAAQRARQVEIERHTDPAPMGAAWVTMAMGWPGHVRVDDDCADGWCWAEDAPQPRDWWAVHEIGHTFPLPDWWQPDDPNQFRRGERWANCYAEALTGVTVYSPLPDLYWDCPDVELAAVAAHVGATIVAPTVGDPWPVLIPPTSIGA